MGLDDPRAKTRKKDDFVVFVAEAAAQRQWAPPALSWEAAGVVIADEDGEATAGDGEDPSPGPIAAETIHQAAA